MQRGGKSRQKIRDGDPPTDRQREIYDYVLARWTEDGRVPTFRGVADHFGVNLSAIHTHLVAMEKRGLVRLKRDGSARGIILILKPGMACPCCGQVIPPGFKDDRGNAPGAET